MNRWNWPEMMQIDTCLENALAHDPGDLRIPMTALLQAGGKRIRPILTMLAAQTDSGYSAQASARLATAVELIHSATLIHDDIVDHSLLRRGEVTIFHHSGTKQAVRIGDYYFGKAGEILAGLANQQVTQTILDAVDKVCHSQLQEFQSRGMPIGIDTYISIVRGKTASLLSAACAAGALLSGAPNPIVRALASYGDGLGIAFQMTDDALDFSDQSGKPLGQDLKEGVLSLPLILAHLDPHLKPRLEAGMAPGGNLAEVARLLAQSGILQQVIEAARQWRDRALDALTVIPQGSVRQRLEFLAQFAVDRSY